MTVAASSDQQRVVHLLMNDARHASRVRRASLALAEAFPNLEVHVLAIRRQMDDLPDIDSWGDRIHVERMIVAARWSNVSISKKIVLGWSWLRAVVRRIRGLNPSIVVFHNAIALALVPVLRPLTQARFVLDAHELESESASLVGRPVLKETVRVLERCFLPKVSATIVVNESIANWYESHYSINNIVVVRNLPDKKLSGGARHRYFHDIYHLSKDTVILIYQGYFGPGRCLIEYCEALERLGDASVALVFMGYGEWRHQLLEKSRSHEGRIFVHEAVPSADVLEYSAAADIGLTVIEPICLSYYMALPNKCFEYLNAGLAVVGSDGPEIRRVIETYRVGVAVSATPDAIAQGIRTLLERGLQSFRDNTKVAVESFDWNIDRSRLVGLFGSLLHGAGNEVSH